MIKAIRWLGYAWLGMATALVVVALAVDGIREGVVGMEEWLTAGYVATIAFAFAPGIAMVALEILFERRRGTDED